MSQHIWGLYCYFNCFLSWECKIHSLLFLLGILQICIICLQNDVKSCGFVLFAMFEEICSYGYWFHAHTYPHHLYLVSPVAFNPTKKSAYTEIYCGSQYSWIENKDYISEIMFFVQRFFCISHCSGKWMLLGTNLQYVFHLDESFVPFNI